MRARLGLWRNILFRITGLSQLEVSDDFKSMYVAFCTLIRSPGRVYLSLDPYEEGIESERDNFSFVGQEIAQIGAGLEG